MLTLAYICLIGRKRGCGLGGKVIYLTCWFKVTVTVMGKCGGTLILRVGVTRRTRAELAKFLGMPKCMSGSHASERGAVAW